MDDEATYDPKEYLRVLQVTAHGSMVDLDMFLRNPMLAGVRSIGQLISILDEYCYLAQHGWIDEHSREVLSKTVMGRKIPPSQNQDLVYGLAKTIGRFKSFARKDIGSLIDTCIDFQMYSDKKVQELEFRGRYLSQN